MPNAYNSSVMKFELRYDWDNEEVENILYVATPAPANYSDVANTCIDLNTWWSTEIKPLQANTVTLREIYGKVMIAGAAPEYTETTGLPSAGTKVGASQPNNVSLAISFRTGFAGRSFRGRNYIIGLVEGDVTNNQVGAAVLNAWQTAYQQLLPAGGYLNFGVWSVYSQFTNGDLRPTGVATSIIAAVFTNDIVDSQRRRLPGRGQ